MDEEVEEGPICRPPNMLVDADEAGPIPIPIPILPIPMFPMLPMPMFMPPNMLELEFDGGGAAMVDEAPPICSPPNMFALPADEEAEGPIPMFPIPPMLLPIWPIPPIPMPVPDDDKDDDADGDGPTCRPPNMLSSDW